MKKLFLVVLVFAFALAFVPAFAEEAKKEEAKPADAVAAPDVKPAAAEADAWLTDYAAAKKLAAEKKLPILIDFSGSDWCGWCMKLENEVFSKEAFKAYAKDNLVLMLADFPQAKPQDEAVKAQNEKLQKEFAVEGYPTVILVDAEGKKIGQTGYQAGGPEKYVEALKELLKGDKKAE